MSNLITTTMKKILLVLLVYSVALSAWAISLSDAKQQGLVGEMPNGYLGIVVDSVEVRALVDGVNKKRKSIYISLAKKNKITLDQVTALAGKKAIAKTQSGQYIKSATGQWRKK